MNILNFPSTDEAIAALAENIIIQGNRCIAENGRFNFVLTGGNSPKKLYQLLAAQYKDAIKWSHVYFFFGDERYVHPADADYNGLMAKNSLLDPLGIAPYQIFFVPTELSPEVAAATYYNEIRKHFSNNEITFDYVLLGMGSDGHTASLFPHTAILDSAGANVEAVYVEKLAAWRISFTAQLINQAHAIAFLVFGQEKAEAFNQLRLEKTDYHDLPAKRIVGNATWYTANLS